MTAGSTTLLMPHILSDRSISDPIRLGPVSPTVPPRRPPGKNRENLAAFSGDCPDSSSECRASTMSSLGRRSVESLRERESPTPRVATRHEAWSRTARVRRGIRRTSEATGSRGRSPSTQPGSKVMWSMRTSGLQPTPRAAMGEPSAERIVDQRIRCHELSHPCALSSTLHATSWRNSCKSAMDCVRSLTITHRWSEWEDERVHLPGNRPAWGAWPRYRYLDPCGPGVCSHGAVHRRTESRPVIPPGREAEVIMIGWVEFDDGGMTRQAILDDDGQWTCDGAPQVAAMLNRDCSPAGDPADDGWGHVALIKAAQRLHGIAWLGPGRPLP